MRRLLVLLVLLAACAAAEHVGTTAELAPCPLAPVGCFRRLDTCEVFHAYCPRVCQAEGHRWHRWVWRTVPEDCLCV